jgi:hypothetical protein
VYLPGEKPDLDGNRNIGIQDIYDFSLGDMMRNIQQRLLSNPCSSKMEVINWFLSKTIGDTSSKHMYINYTKYLVPRAFGLTQEDPVAYASYRHLDVTKNQLMDSLNTQLRQEIRSYGHQTVGCIVMVFPNLPTDV